MRLTPFDPTMADGLARCYNDLIAPVPECHPVTADRFASLAGLASPLLRDEAMMVVRGDDGKVQGFVHVGISTPSKDSDDPPAGLGVIRVLACRPGARPVGAALLEWAEDWAREQGRTALIAWSHSYRYPFYHFHCAHLSEHIGHVRALFGMAGYAEFLGELFLTWRDFTPPAAERPAIRFEAVPQWSDGRLGPRLEMRAMQRGQHVGTCIMDRGQDSPSPEAQDWCFCDLLWVTERLQGQRLGSYLLATALLEMHRAGCRHASISTLWTNYRAVLMYTNLGYRHADRTCAFTRQLAARSKHAGFLRALGNSATQE